MDEPTLPEAPPLADVPRTTRLLAGRYEVLGFITRGGSGWVDRAVDHFTGREVVVKWISAATTHDLERIRREITSLRWLRLPGVVRLLHDGHDRYGWYIVMERVEGRPFPGVPVPAPWSTLEGPAIGLLRVLDRVHGAGILHADLKPGNVLVQPDGAVVVLDFGISDGAALPPQQDPVASGTPGFLAPEIQRGGQRDARSDLYAVGVMLAASLTGRVGPVPDGAAPAAVVALLNELIDPDPRRRPASAEDTLGRLGASPRPIPVTADGPATEEELRELFAGPEELLHLRTEGARVLHQRTGGDRARVAAELTQWVADGVGYQVDGGVRVDLVALEALDEREEENRLNTLLARGAPAAEVGAEALRVSDWWLRLGRPRRATAVLERAVRAARESRAAPTEAALLEAWTRAALAQESAPATNRAICEIRRSPWRTLRLDELESLLRAFEAFLEGRPREMAEQLGVLGPYDDEDLDGWRNGLRVRLGRQRGVEEAVLHELESWADTPGKRARWMGWMGNFRYQQGRFAEAAELHLASAPERPTRGSWISAVQNAAAALLEVPDLDRARELAQTIVAESRAGGLATYEALGTRILRVADYRAGLPIPPAPHLVSAAAFLQPGTEGILATAEAAIAWRAGQVELAGTLAARAEAAYRSGNLGGLAAFCRALATAFQGGGQDEWRALVEASARMIPAHRMQVLALALTNAERPDPSWANALEPLVAAVSPSRRELRLDLLSAAECAAACDRVRVGDLPSRT